MLEQMRRSSQSLLIYLLFGIVIAVFIVNFGPQSPGCDGSQTATASEAATVDGRSVTAQDFRYGFFMLGGGQASAQQARAGRLKETVMDKLIERELLAREAERLGFRVSEEEVEDFIARSKLVALGEAIPAPVLEKNGAFDYEMFKRFVQLQLGMSVRGFLEEQRREMLALRMRQLLVSGVNVSTDEIKTDFVRRSNQVNIEYLRYPVRRYEGEITLTPQEIEAHAKANEQKLKDLYTQRKFLYEKVPKERKVRQLLVKVDSGASEDVWETAKKKAETLLGRVKKGEAFAAVAKAASDDARTKGRGGELGWRREGTTGLGSEIEQKLWAAKDGEVVGPIKNADGWVLAVAEGAREGDIPFEQVRLELAEDQLRQEKAKALAKEAADAALAKAKASADKPLKELFPAPSDKDLAAATEAPPQAEETGLFMRRGDMVEGIGPSPEMAKAVFELTTESPFTGPIEVAGSYIVAKLKERKVPDMAEFEKTKLELARQASLVKGMEVTQEWALRRCNEAKDSKKIDVNKELLRYEQGPEGIPAYEPCTPPFRM